MKVALDSVLCNEELGKLESGSSPLSSGFSSFLINFNPQIIQFTLVFEAQQRHKPLDVCMSSSTYVIKCVENGGKSTPFSRKQSFALRQARRSLAAMTRSG